MNRLEYFLVLSSLAFQILLCAIIFARKAHRILPLFTTYACVLLLTTTCYLFTSTYFGFGSQIMYRGFWISAYIYAFTFGLAIAELCRYELRRYRGIWALAWRVLVGLAVLLMAHAWLNAHGQPSRLEILGSTFLRDFAFASMIILAALLLIRNYYGIALPPLQRSVAMGMCFTCAVDAVGYTVFRNALTGYLYPLFVVGQKALWPALVPYSRRLDDIWSTVHLGAFMISMAIWCYALRKPVPEENESAELLPVEVYREMSPAINLRLAAVNSRLQELLKP